jgi:hypothetical protein
MATFTNAGDSNDGIVGTTTSHDHNGVNGRNDDTTARNAATPEGNGVFGTTKVPDGAGVFGLHESNGVGVAGFGNPTGIGVAGISTPAGAKGGDGVLGVTNSEHRNGIVGLNDSTVARVTAEPGGNGIFGFSQVPDGAGVFGSHGVTGIGVAGLGLIGVSGGSFNGVGVLGVSKPPGGTGAGDGVQGITNSPIRNGIYGLNESTDKHGTNDPGGNGVLGFSNVTDGAGVMGAHGSGGHGLYGTGGFGVTGTGTNIGVWGISKDAGWAGYFTGPINVTGTTTMVDVEVTGQIDCSTIRTLQQRILALELQLTQFGTHVADSIIFIRQLIPAGNLGTVPFSITGENFKPLARNIMVTAAGQEGGERVDSDELGTLGQIAVVRFQCQPGTVLNITAFDPAISQKSNTVTIICT